MKKENLAILEMLLAAVLWSIAGIFIKLIPWNAFALASVRSLIAGLTIALYMRCAKIRLVLNRKTWLAGLLAGCTYLCFVCANKLTTAANAIVLQYTNPVFILLFSALFLKAKIRKADLAVVLLTLGGIALFFFDQLKPGYLLSNCVAIASGMFLAGMYVSVGNLPPQERFSAITLAQFFTFLAGLPFVFATKPAFTAAAVGSVLVLGVFQLGLAYILYVRASRCCPPLACSLLAALEPLLNPFWVFLFDGERPGIFALIGMVVVVVTVTAWCILDQRKAPEETSNA